MMWVIFLACAILPPEGERGHGHSDSHGGTHEATEAGPTTSHDVSQKDVKKYDVPDGQILFIDVGTNAHDYREVSTVPSSIAFYDDDGHQVSVSRIERIVHEGRSELKRFDADGRLLDVTLGASHPQNRIDPATLSSPTPPTKSH